MINFFVRHFLPDVWNFEEARVSPSCDKYSKGPILNESVVEKGILPLVRCLNRPDLGLETIASCQGHYFSRREPYVYFKSDPIIVRLLAKKIWDMVHVADPQKLHYLWGIKPTFNGEFEICFHLSISNRYDIFASIWGYLQWRKALQADFEKLRILIVESLEELRKVQENGYS